MEILNRTIAASKTVEAYSEVPFEWCKNDCGRMAVKHLKNMGHKVSIIKSGRYGNLEGAKLALKRQGFDSLEEAFDSRFDRIAPASALVGDIVTIPTETLLNAIGVVVAHNSILHTHNGGFAISAIGSFVAAWRIPCLVDYSQELETL